MTDTADNKTETPIDAAFARVKALEAALDDERAARQALRAHLDLMGSVVSHDLRGPTRHINVFSDLLRASLDPAPEAASEHLDHIQTAAGRLFEMIDVLAHHIRALGREPQLGKTCLQTCVQSVLTALDRDIKAAGAVFEMEDLPNVYCDPDLTTTVFTEVFLNALRHGTGDPNRIEVSVRVEKAATIYVRDFGPGLGDINPERAFALFGGVKRSTSQSVCQGLATCRALMEAQHGGIWLENAEPGLCAVIELQLYAPDLRQDLPDLGRRD